MYRPYGHYVPVLQLRKEWRRVCAPGCENIRLLRLNYKKAWARNWGFQVFLPLTEPLLFIPPLPYCKTEATETDALSQVDLREICHKVTTSLLRKCIEWIWYRCQYSWKYYMSSHSVKAPLRIVKDLCPPPLSLSLIWLSCNEITTRASGNTSASRCITL